jgi:hypothetical protein
MWDQYRKNFVGMQIVICLMTIAIYFLSGRQLGSAVTFLGTMQIAALLGAYWGHSLKQRIRGRA